MGVGSHCVRGESGSHSGPPAHVACIPKSSVSPVAAPSAGGLKLLVVVVRLPVVGIFPSCDEYSGSECTGSRRIAPLRRVIMEQKSRCCWRLSVVSHSRAHGKEPKLQRRPWGAAGPHQLGSARRRCRGNFGWRLHPSKPPCTAVASKQKQQTTTLSGYFGIGSDDKKDNQR